MFGSTEKTPISADRGSASRSHGGRHLPLAPARSYCVFARIRAPGHAPVPKLNWKPARRSPPRYRHGRCRPAVGPREGVWAAARRVPSHCPRCEVLPGVRHTGRPARLLVVRRTRRAGRGKFCGECGTTLDGPSRPPAPGSTAAAEPVAERRLTTVLFGDLVGLHGDVGVPRRRGRPRAAVAVLRHGQHGRRPLRRHRREVHRRRGDGGVGRAGRPRGRRRARRARRPRPGRARSRRWRARSGSPAWTCGSASSPARWRSPSAPGEGMVAGDAVNTAARIQAAADARPGVGGRDHAVADVGGGHLRRRRRAPPEGQGGAGAAARGRAVVAASAAPSGSTASRRRSGPGPRAAPGQGAVPRRRRARPPALVVVVRAGRRRQDAAGVGVREVRRRPTEASSGTAAGACPTATASASGRWPRWCAPGSASPRRTRRRRRREADDRARSLVADRSEREWLRPRLAALLGVAATGGGFGRDDLFAAWAAFFERLGEADGRRARRSTTCSTPTTDLLDFLDHLLETARLPAVRADARPARTADRARPGWGPAGGPRRVPRAARRAGDDRDRQRSRRRAAGQASRRAGRARGGHPAVRAGDGARADRPRRGDPARRPLRPRADAPHVDLDDARRARQPAGADRRAARRPARRRAAGLQDATVLGLAFSRDGHRRLW